LVKDPSPSHHICEDRPVPRSFSVTTRTGARVEDLFDASLSIDEHLESMRSSGELAIAGVTSGRIGLGESVTWRARHFGIRFTMTSRITALDRPHRFVDEQLRGPFRTFRHEHVFRTEGAETVMTDTLTIGSPVFGALAERVILVPYLRRLIRQRNAHLIAAVAPRPPTHTHPALRDWPDDAHPRFRRAEASVLIGRGDATWDRASHDVLSWAVKTRSGFLVDARGPVQVGDRPVIRARALGVTITEPVEVIAVVNEPTRIGFAYRTLTGHPVLGEESFIVSREDTSERGRVRLTIRSLTAPAPHQPWRMLHPILLVAQRIARRRYLRALR
jgi:uncharacterized protein (UPF0548 family)/ligand-binding SRPBCC domain-containing protein